MSRILPAALISAAIGALLCAAAAHAQSTTPVDDDDADADQIALDTDLAAERARIDSLLRSPNANDRARACRQLAFSGIGDPALFDWLEQHVLWSIDETLRGNTMEKSLPSCARGLASSGNPKYRATLDRAFHTKPKWGAAYQAMRKSLYNSLMALDRFPQWNAIINDTSTHLPNEPWAATRAYNMISSHDSLLAHEGMSRTQKIGASYPPIYDRVEQLLLRAVERPPASREEEDIHAWYCKLLGISRNPKYSQTLSYVAKRSGSKKIQKYAESSLDRLKP